MFFLQLVVTFVCNSTQQAETGPSQIATLRKWVPCNHTLQL